MHVFLIQCSLSSHDLPEHQRSCINGSRSCSMHINWVKKRVKLGKRRNWISLWWYRDFTSLKKLLKRSTWRKIPKQRRIQTNREVVFSFIGLRYLNLFAFSVKEANWYIVCENDIRGCFYEMKIMPLMFICKFACLVDFLLLDIIVFCWGETVSIRVRMHVSRLWSFVLFRLCVCGMCDFGYCFN